MRRVSALGAAPVRAAAVVSLCLGACAGDDALDSLDRLDDEARAVVAGSALAAGGERAVTLITGDRVRLAPGPDGRTVVTIDPGPGRDDVGFAQRRTGAGGDEEIHVVPFDAARLIDRGRLDPALFDVTELARRGDELRLIVRPGAGARSRAAITSMGARMGGTPLASVDAIAVTEPADQVGAVWAALSGASLAAGAPAIETVWLDRVFTPVLDRSAVQVGAPAAWASGHDGTGAVVAILDTGVDARHPDLVDRIRERRDFTGTDAEAGDTVGHGTHVAGIIAGSGAASAGRFRGIAPGAALVIGKVCATDGCYESDIIAGMEWAAAQAPVVNMSLGGRPRAEADLVELALDALSAEHGTLFVVAAGNVGGNETIGSPGTAEAALTVGSVSKTDVMSVFSSRGPRRRDGGLKPELVAPGGDIVAARAAGTYPDLAVDEHHARLSGTSMATPHVSAAAAILAAAHPDWDSTRLKAALVGTAARIADAEVGAQGAGRLDVAAAIAAEVHATPTALGFASVPWPHDAAPQVRTVTVHNDSAVERRFDLRLDVRAPDGEPVPPGAVTLSASSLVIPAHGTREVAVTVAALPRTSGYLGGWLEAVSGDQRIVVPLGVRQEVHRCKLTFQLIGRDGAPGSWGDIALTDRDSPGWYYVEPDENGFATLTVLADSYSLGAILESGDDEAAAGIGVTLFVTSEIVVDRDQTIVLDARDAQRVEATVERAGAALVSHAIQVVVDSTAAGGWQEGFAVPGDVALYATPAHPVPGQTISSARAFELEGVDGAGPYRYQLGVFDASGIPDDLSTSVRDRDLARVETVYRGAAGLSLSRSVTGFVDDSSLAAWSPAREVVLPARETVLYTPGDDLVWLTEVSAVSPETGGDDYLQRWQRVRRGWNLDDWFRPAVGPAFAADLFGPSSSFEADGRMWIAPSLFGPAGRHTLARIRDADGTVTLRRDGALVGTMPGVRAPSRCRRGRPTTHSRSRPPIGRPGRARRRGSTSPGRSWRSRRPRIRRRSTCSQCGRRRRSTAMVSRALVDRRSSRCGSSAMAIRSRW
jgi:subtilisin family serine protease